MRIILFILVFIASSALAKSRTRTLSPPRKLSGKATSPYSIEVKWRDRGSGRKAKNTRKYFVRYGLADLPNVNTTTQNLANPPNVKTVTEELQEEGRTRLIRTTKRKLKLQPLLPGSSYQIEVKVMKGKRSSPWSDPVRVTTPKENPEDIVVTDFNVTILSSSDAQLSWRLPSESKEVLEFTAIAEPTNGKGRPKKVSLYNTATSYVIGKLRANQQYSFSVRSKMSKAPHPISRPVLARTFSAAPDGTPQKLELNALNSSLVLVSWRPPNQRSRNGQVTGYKLGYKRRGEGQGKVVTVETKYKKFHLTDITSNTTYKVRVAAFNINGTGPYTGWRNVHVPLAESDLKEASKTPPTFESRTHAAPLLSLTNSTPDPSPSPSTEVKVVNKTTTSLYLTWSDPVTSEDLTYRVSVRNMNDSKEKYEFEVQTNQVLISDLRPGTLYGVNVTTLNDTGSRNSFQELLVTTLPGYPPVVTYYEAPRVNIGGDSNLTCKVESDESPDIVWYIRSTQGLVNVLEISESNITIAETVTVIWGDEGHGLKTSSLILHNVMATAEREYLCFAKNSAGIEWAKNNLIVDEPPEVSVDTTWTVRAEERVHVECSARGKPSPEVLWVDGETREVVLETDPTLPANQLPRIYTTSGAGQESHVTKTVLVIQQAELEDAGVYACLARSRSGQEEVTMTLDVRVPRPPPVSKIQTIPLSPSRVSLNWFPPLNFSYPIRYYQVTFQTSEDGPVSALNVSRIGTELYDLTHDTDYFVGVMAASDDGVGAPGPLVRVRTLSNVGLEPADLSFVILNATSLQLKWKRPANISELYIRGFHIHYREAGVEKIETVFLDGGQSSFFLRDLDPDSTYFLMVSTVMTWGFEASSHWLTVEPRSYAFQPPPKPEGFRAVPTSEGISVSWNKEQPDIPVEGYTVIYNPTGEYSIPERVLVDANHSAIHLKNVKPLTEYTISIRAFNNFGDGHVAFATATTPSFSPTTVQNARVIAVSSTEIHVQWEPPARGHVTRYHIRYWRTGRKDKQSAWMLGNFRNYVAGSLRKNTNYRFEIIPYNGDLPGEGIITFVSTLGDKPDGPPLDIVLRAVNETILVASWQPPDPELVNGRVKGYKLVLKKKNGPRLTAFRVAGSKRNFTFYDMDVTQSYLLRMAAITANGSGVNSQWVESTYSTTERPMAPEKLSIKPDVTSIHLAWTRPKFTGSPISGYIVGFGQFIPDAYRVVLPESQLDYTIDHLAPNSGYIISLRAFNAIGESSASFRRVRTERVPAPKAPILSPIKLTVQSPSATSLLITWVDPALLYAHERDERIYQIRYSPLSGESYNYVNTTDLQLLLTDLEPATFYDISVRTIRGDVSSSWGLPVLNSTQQTAPQSAPEKITVRGFPDDPTILRLNWTKPFRANGNIEEYIIYHTTDPALDTKLWTVVAADVPKVTVREVTPHTTYYIRLQARNSVGYGPLSDVVIYDPPPALPTPKDDTHDSPSPTSSETTTSGRASLTLRQTQPFELPAVTLTSAPQSTQEGRATSAPRSTERNDVPSTSKSSEPKTENFAFPSIKTVLSSNHSTFAPVTGENEEMPRDKLSKISETTEMKHKSTHRNIESESGEVDDGNKNVRSETYYTEPTWN